MIKFACSKQITDLEAFVEDLQYVTGLLELTPVIGELERQSIDAAFELSLMHEAIESVLLDNCTTAGLLMLNIDQARSKMRVAPEEFSSRWSLPSLWGAELEMARFLDTLVDGAGKIQLMANQESKVQKSVLDLVTVQTQSMLERVRTV
jgi:TRAP-type mannitol/chloroaromatic compound transport system substrate-binding protein